MSTVRRVNNIERLGIVNIPLWLRDTHAIILPQALNRLPGYKPDDVNREIDALKSFNRIMRGSDPFEDEYFFISSDNIVNYIYDNPSTNYCDYIITFVIHSLRDLYWNKRYQLPRDAISDLEINIDKILPSFEDIFDYDTLQDQRERYPIPLYQMTGTISSYNVVHMPVSQFIDYLNQSLPITNILSGINVMIGLHYEEQDFWNEKQGRLITQLNIC